LRQLATNDVVVLRRDLPEHGLVRGTKGTVVSVFEHPSLAYEIEFCDDAGRSIVQVALRPDDLDAGTRGDT
jgi:hypothetical protein